MRPHSPPGLFPRTHLTLDVAHPNKTQHHNTYSYVRSQIGQRISLRLTPEVRFEYDDSIEEEELVQQVLGPDEFDRLARLAAAEARGGAVDDEEEEDEEEDDDGGFFDLEEGGEGGEEAVVEKPPKRPRTRPQRPRGFNEPGPFDFLFGDIGADAESSGGGGGRGGRGKGGRGGGGGGGGGKKQQRQKQQS